MSDTEAAIKLLERNRVGALLRVFAATPEEVDQQVQSALTALRKLLVLKTGDRKTFARIDFLVSTDTDFEDHDCGRTAQTLRDRIRAEFPEAPVQVYEIRRGDIYAMLLNYGVAIQLENRVPYSLIISHREHEHIVEANIHALFAAMHNKARVAGLTLPEIQDTILEGRVANTFAIWHNKSLVTIGGFDLRASKPLLRDAATTPVLQEPNEAYQARFGDNIASYQAAGCEEIIPLLRFVRFFGKSIKVIDPIDTKAIPAPEVAFSEAGIKRHLAKLATKDVRQRYMAEQLGQDIDRLKAGLIA